MGLAISRSSVGVAWWALVGYRQRPTGCNLSFQHADRRDRVIRRLPIIPTLESECGITVLRAPSRGGLQHGLSRALSFA